LILADDPVDFLRLLTIGYDEICWGDAYMLPPGTFHVTIPTRAIEIVRHPASMDDEHSPDAFW